MKKKNIILVAILVLATVSCRNAGRQISDTGTSVNEEEPRQQLVICDDRDSLNIYTPLFTRMDLVTGTMPSKDEEDVILCCEAAFTGELLSEFRHSNIAGHHVSGGVFHRGYKCGPNNGVFTWSKSGWHFYNYGHKNSETPLKVAAEQGGMGFCQSLLFYDGQRLKGCFRPEIRNQYRALCELDGRLCIIDCSRALAFGSFMDGLQRLGVRNAIYCDMGYGWNYSWYRQDNGKVKEIFPTPGEYTTNWVTFYREKDASVQ